MRSGPFPSGAAAGNRSPSISLYVYAYYLAALVVCGLCLWRGDQPLRLIAIVTIVSWSVTPLVGFWDRDHLNAPQTMIDLATAALYVWISLRWRRLWAAGLSALGILVVLCPLVYVADPRVHRNSWVAANNILAISQLGTLLLALWSTLRGQGGRPPR